MAAVQPPSIPEQPVDVLSEDQLKAPARHLRA